jgi:hypothetical protein
MAFGSDRAANFVVKAKDAATGPLGKIGGAMGKLKSAAGTAFKAIAAGAVAAAAAVAAFTVSAIKSAMDDEASTIRLNAALKARGQNMDTLGPKIDAQIKAMARLGFTDDQVRAGLETGSRFFKNQKTLLAANAAAANIAAATGKDLASVQMILGRAAQGSTRGLNALGITVEKGAKIQDILTAANKKYAGVADQVANSTSGKFAAAQITLNEQIEAFGYKFLPAVNKALDYLTGTLLPMVTPALDALGAIIFKVAGTFGDVATSVGKVVGPILVDLKPAFDKLVESVGGFVGSVGDLIAVLWGDGDGALGGAFKLLGGAIKAAFELAAPFFDALKWLVDNITTIIDAIQKIAGAQTVEKGAAAAQNSTVFSMGTGIGGSGGNAGGTTGSYTSGYTVAPVAVVIGTKAQSTLSYSYGNAANVTNAQRTNPSYRP